MHTAIIAMQNDPGFNAINNVYMCEYNCLVILREFTVGLIKFNTMF